MHLSSESLKYLTGERFATTYQVTFETNDADFELRTRIDLLREHVKGKRAVHVGCVDHDIKTITKKIGRDEWLHKLLCHDAERCLGIDIDEAGIAFLKKELGYTDVETLDISAKPSNIVTASHWNYMVLAEIVEHFDNPVEYLTRIREFYREHIDQLIVTVPNAFSAGNFRHATAGTEHINSDHRYWFTPYTISKVLTRAGFQMDVIRMCVRKRHRSFWKNARQRKSPILRNGIIVVASF